MNASETPTAVYHDTKLEKDVRVPLGDGSHLVADVFRPAGAGRFPAVMTLGPYSKDIHFRDWNKRYPYDQLPERGPYMHWETVNPESGSSACGRVTCASRRRRTPRSPRRRPIHGERLHRHRA